MFEQLIDLDRDLLLYLNNAGHVSWDPFFLTITLSTLWIPLFLYFIWLAFTALNRPSFYNTIWTALLLILSVALFGFFVKYSIARPRPHQLLDFATQLRVLKPISGYSFFSGHAASSFAIVTFLCLVLRRLRPWVYGFYIWAFLYSYSRIYLGVHFPLDSLVGALFGTSFALFFYRGLQFKKWTFLNLFS